MRTVYICQYSESNKRKIIEIMVKFSKGVFHIGRLFVKLVLNKATINCSVGLDGLTFSIKERKKNESKGFEMGVD